MMCLSGITTFSRPVEIGLISGGLLKFVFILDSYSCIRALFMLPISYSSLIFGVNSIGGNGESCYAPSLQMHLTILTILISIYIQYSGQ